jgi:prepilin-type N-terminal cleavage/methylation domain-containing protein
MTLSVLRPCPKAAPAMGPQAGFTLIEMIVSLAILSIALGVLFAAFSQSLDRQQLNRRQGEALLLANTLLNESMIADMRPTAAQGATEDGLSWRVAVAPYGGDDDRKAWRFAPALVTATVQWSMNGRSHSLSVQTIRPLPAGGAK